VTSSRREFIGKSLALAVFPKDSSLKICSSAAPSEQFWYGRAAERWFEALPLGNGHLGAMVFGGVTQERLALSECTAWSGAPGTQDVNDSALSHLAHIRELLFKGSYVEARALCEKHLLAHPRSFGTNLPLPELNLDFGDKSEATDYRRTLDLDLAIARVTYRRGTCRFTREVIASHPHNLVAIRLTCNRAKQLSFKVSFAGLNLPATVVTEDNDKLVLRGHAYERMHSNGHDGVKLQIRAQVLPTGGSISTSGQQLHVQNADAVTILLVIATDFSGVNPEEACRARIARANKLPYAEIRRAHVVDHQSLYRRLSVDLGSTESRLSRKPTDERRRALAAGAADPQLLALFFQYGRYVTIAGSREDSPLPLALQGIWNDGLASSMGWTDDFHLDINTQQNYWPTEVCNLSECQTPLFRLIQILRASGRNTAKRMYGAPGWVCHTIANPWGYTAPGSGLGWGLAVTAGIWISLQLWEHFRFTGDIDFLRNEAYPVLREAAEFFLAYMVPHPTHGWLVTGPSDSPENSFLTPGGERCSESMGPTCDRVLVHSLYSICIEASSVLSIDAQLRGQLLEARSKLSPLQIGSKGQLQEWLEDFEDADPNHRHTSHLIALYPEHQITPDETPDLARAAMVTLERRLNSPNWEQSEWGRANLINYYARLCDGNRAYTHLIGLLAKGTEHNLLTFSSGGVAGAEQNIFAIDGNTAGTAGMAEMLIQSHRDVIHLLPALPAAWPGGSIYGLRARGGFEVNLAWHEGKLLSATLLNSKSVRTEVRYGDKTISLHVQANHPTPISTRSFLDT